MEKRAILAAMLMAGLLIAYQALFTPPAPETPPPATAPAKQSAPAPDATGAAQPVPAAQAPPVPAAQAPPSTPAPPVPDRSLSVETPLYRVVISSAGGAFREWEVNFKGQRPMVAPGILGPSGIVVERPGSAPQVVAFALPSDPVKLGPQSSPGEVTMVGEDGFGLRITRMLRFRADTYAVAEEIRVENRQAVAQQAQLAMYWTAPVEWPKEAEANPAPRPIHVVRLGAGESWAHREYLASAVSFVGNGRWVGLESGLSGVAVQPNGVYLTAVIPKSSDMKVIETVLVDPGDAKKTPKTVQIGLQAPLPVLGPGQRWEGHAITYVGPMDYERLKAFDVGLEKAIYFGGFPVPESWARSGFPTIPMEWIAVPILWLMHWFYGFMRNYGLAIMVLTVIFKVVFFPLTVKSMKSMKAMQAIQPQVNALRAKYKSEPQKVQQETMELYRKHGVNPLGGCLPMIVQIPIFYALYVALAVSVELQNAPFLCFGRLFGMDLWICDLAAQDPTYVLPLLMGVTMFIQQKMTPVMGDPRQAKMMLFMPVVFTFMFLNLPSGLVLYWTLSNVLQIAQQHYMNREGKEGKEGKSEKAPARAAKKA